MPRLNLQSLSDHKWDEIGVRLPAFDIMEMRKRTFGKPEWIHFGAGNIFRGFIADNYQALIESGKTETGIIAVETFDHEIIDRIYKPYDNLSLNITTMSDGSLEKNIMASVAEALKAGPAGQGDEERLRTIFKQKSLKLASFTVTEKGYSITDPDGSLSSMVERDLETGPAKSVHLMSIVTSLMLHRYKNGAFPLALVSADNCSRNGEKLKNTILRIADGWRQRGFVEQGFVDYLQSPADVTFPWTMIDRITPHPSASIKCELEKLGIESIEPIVTGRNTHIAPFVNSEEIKYFVIEDSFPNGRFPLDDTDGVWFTDRDIVEKAETMKVTTCLNPLHTVIAILGCLFGYKLVYETIEDPEVERLVKRIGYDEGLPVVCDPGIINPEDFINEVFEKRVRNKRLADSPARIACDTSLKIGIRFGETIKSWLLREEGTDKLAGIPLLIAAWCRYLLGTDDSGEEMELSPDPQKDQLAAVIRKGQAYSEAHALKELLSNKSIFGVDLYEAGLGFRIEEIFDFMCAGPGKVREAIKYFLP